MTIEEDVKLTFQYGEVHDTLDLIDRLTDNLKLFSICNIGTKDPHFIVAKTVGEDTLIARIYLTKPKYLIGDLILSEDELDLLYNSLINGSWEKIFKSMNREGKFCINNYRDLYIDKIPYYKGGIEQ